MTVIADSGAIYAIYDADDAYHEAVSEFIERENGAIIIPDVILVEIDYLLREFLGVPAEIDFMNDLLAGAYEIEAVNLTDISFCLDLIEQYRDLDLGLADSAVMTLAERLKIYRILTVDERDFRAVRPKGRHSFVVLPADQRDTR